MDPNLTMDGVFIKRGNLDTEISTQGECNMKMTAGNGMTIWQANKCQRLPANCQKLEKSHRMDFSSHPSEPSYHNNTWSPTSSLQIMR